GSAGTRTGSATRSRTRASTRAGRPATARAAARATTRYVARAVHTERTAAAAAGQGDPDPGARVGVRDHGEAEAVGCRVSLTGDDRRIAERSRPRRRVVKIR